MGGPGEGWEGQVWGGSVVVGSTITWQYVNSKASMNLPETC